MILFLLLASPSNMGELGELGELLQHHPVYSVYIITIFIVFMFFLFFWLCFSNTELRMYLKDNWKYPIFGMYLYLKVSLFACQWVLVSYNGLPLKLFIAYFSFPVSKLEKIKINFSNEIPLYR